MDKIMFNEYVDKAMQHAHYEQIEDGTYFGWIPGFKGVWANKPTEQECRKELREVLEGWILLNIADHTPLPSRNGNNYEVSLAHPNGDNLHEGMGVQVENWLATH
jgi:predicted RNase H-like HicB family nuclease